MGTLSHESMHRAAADGLSRDRFFRSQGYLKTPRLVQWLVTGRCSLRCGHCLSAGLGGAEPSLSQAGRILDQVAALGVDELLITGGEPLARADFHILVAMLAERGLSWSLNSAVRPNAQAQRAMEAHPPRFVAVSLDGPREVHDAFRGRAGAFDAAMWSLAYYGDLCAGAVAAGTTVTARNVDHLDATFPLVLGSGAGSWGLHLLVPEGRAAGRSDLDLRRWQERSLLHFVADRRQHFPVQMADEIGFCGPFEPLVRDAPFFCGAGRAGCVILPDGAVVPCTTSDRRSAAGNVHLRPLADIWRTGFSALRRRVPEGKCRTCADASLCGGGCWLRRRRGEACARPVWRVSKAASVACLSTLLGLAAPFAQADHPDAAPTPNDVSEQRAQQMQILQRSIVAWYAAGLGGRRAPEGSEVLADLRAALPDDPGARYFLAFAAGDRPGSLSDLADRIEAATRTRQRSLCLIGLFFQDLLHWSLSGPAPAARSPAQRARLARLLALLGGTAEAWRAQIFAQRLDPFLRRPEDYRRFLISKAGPTARQRVEGKLAQSRGFNKPDRGADFLKIHPHAGSMVLDLGPVTGLGLRVRRRGRTEASDGRMEIFDLLLTPPLRPVPLSLHLGKEDLVVLLPPAAELSYGDLLRLIYEQHRARLDRQVAKLPGRPPRSPLLLPALLARRDALTASQERERLRLDWLLTDLFLF